MREVQPKSKISSKIQDIKDIGKIKKRQTQENLVLTRYSYKQNLGITLIALVVTIVVMLILAGITLQTALGDEDL